MFYMATEIQFIMINDPNKSMFTLSIIRQKTAIHWTQCYHIALVILPILLVSLMGVPDQRLSITMTTTVTQYLLIGTHIITLVAVSSKMSYQMEKIRTFPQNQRNPDQTQNHVTIVIRIYRKITQITARNSTMDISREVFI